ncbi:hypothetical protein PYW07_009089 [Mythimna separata]|uniref:Ig-like domain-containing protein n=1 Tax=Mythimna separata TaxID=271217 RepID=A0AAD7YAY0_MYTSE|nr:hypothetical protein PYW07_009089 [Mythimna separata]
MLKLLLLTVVFTLFGVKESNAYWDFPNLKWSEGSTINEPVGPENAIYCRLDNSKQKTVVDGFGPCRIVVDRVTPEHMGYWRIRYAVPGMVAAQYDYFHVEVLTPAVEPKLVVTSSVVRNDTSVVVTCSVPQEHEIVSCTFRNPGGDFFVASQQEETGTRYSSVAGPHNCSLRFLVPEEEQAGIWRCAVQTIRGTGYSFPLIYNSMLNPENDDYIRDPVLQARKTIVEGSEGGATTMFCSIDASIRYCYFRSPNGTVINLSPSTSTADYEYLGNGLEAGECGIRVKNLQPSDQGRWSCNIAQVGYVSEERETITVYVNDGTTVEHRWIDSGVVVSMRMGYLPLEYCRFVRNDGLGFVSDNVPSEYIFNDFMTGAWSQELKGICELTIPRPQAVDLRPWTIVAKVVGEDTERSVRTTFDPRSVSGGSSSTCAIILWCSFGTIFLFLIIVSCLPKKNREWTAARAARIRNSFRRQHHHQPPHIVVNGPHQHIPPPNQHVPPPMPQPIHTDILTDLPRKV